MNNRNDIPSLEELRGKDYVPFSDKRWRNSDLKELLAGLEFDNSQVTEEAKRKHDELMKHAAEIRKAQQEKEKKNGKAISES